MIWTLAIWCLLGCIINRMIQPFWPSIEVLLTSPFWPVLLLIELRTK